MIKHNGFIVTLMKNKTLVKNEKTVNASGIRIRAYIYYSTVELLKVLLICDLLDSGITC